MAMVNGTDIVRVLNLGSVTFLSAMGLDNEIIQAARTVFDRANPHVLHDAEKFAFIHKMWADNNLKPLEIVDIKFKIKAPRFIHEIWLEVKASHIIDSLEINDKILPEFYFPENFPESAKETCLSLYSEYEKLLENKVSSTIAKIILPNNIYVSWTWKVNLRDLLNFLLIYLGEKSSFEMLAYAKELATLTKAIVPLTYSAFENYALNAIFLHEREFSAIKETLLRQKKASYTRTNLKQYDFSNFSKKLAKIMRSK